MRKKPHLPTNDDGAEDVDNKSEINKGKVVAAQTLNDDGARMAEAIIAGSRSKRDDLSDVSPMTA